MKYKTGDKVKLIPDLKIGIYEVGTGTLNITENDLDLIEKELIIKNKDERLSDIMESDIYVTEEDYILVPEIMNHVGSIGELISQRRMNEIQNR